MSRPYGAGETFNKGQLAVATGMTVTGGRYIFAQTATAYGTINLQVLGPDGTNWQTMVTKSASDTTGGTEVVLSADAKVRVTETGTTGSAYALGRVPTA